MVDLVLLVSNEEYYVFILKFGWRTTDDDNDENAN